VHCNISVSKLFTLLYLTGDTMKKNTQTLIDASKEVGLEINAEKTKLYVAVLSPECGPRSRELTDPLKIWHSSNIWE
jgi:hypothetical protein